MIWKAWNMYTSSSSAFSSYFSGVHHVWSHWWDICVCDRFLIQPQIRGSHIPFSWMVHAGWVFFVVVVVVFLPAFTHLGHECQDLLSLCNGMHVHTDYWLDLSLHSHPKEFGRNGVRTHVNFKGKKSLYQAKFTQQRIEPTMLHQAGQWAQHTTNELFRPPDMYKARGTEHRKYATEYRNREYTVASTDSHHGKTIYSKNITVLVWFIISWSISPDSGFYLGILPQRFHRFI